MRPASTRATATAVLSANYVATRLEESFPVLYRGHGGLVAHECILDLRGLAKETGVTVDDVAKRLIDYGFHAPTMSFPVAGTLMVEPTESEDLAEIDRFIDAMIAIRGEIDRVAAGEWTPEESPLRARPAHRAGAVGQVEAGLPARARRASRPDPTRTSTGRRSPGSTRRTATATWSAPARRPKPSSSKPMADSRLQSCLDHLQAEGRLPSIVGGVLLGGDLVWSGAAGEVAGDDPADVQYRIGSITKTLVTAAVLRCRDDGLLSLDDPLGRFVPESGYAHASVRSLLAHTSGMQSEPVGSWWERSPGVDVRTLLEANDGSGAVAERGGVPPLQQPRLRPARRDGRPDPGRVLVGRRGDHDPGAARDDPHDLPTAGAVRTGLQRRPLQRHPHPRAAPGHRRDGTGRTGVEHRRGPRALGPVPRRSVTPRCSTSRPSARRPTPRRPAPEYGLGLRLVPWHGRFLVGHTGSMPGFVASLSWTR